MHKVWHNYFVCCVFILLLTGCQSARVTDTAVIEHQRQLDEYKSTVDSFVRRADECAGEINSIRNRASGITEEVDRVIQLFDDYQHAVDRFIREYNSLRDKVKELDKNLDNTGINTASDDTYKDSGVHNVLQGN